MPLPRVLLVINADNATAPHISGPRKDYRVLAETLGAATIDRSSVKRSFLPRQLMKVLGVAPLQAWLAFRERHNYDVIMTDGEQVGLPLALLLKLARSHVGHVTIGHRLTAPKKRLLFTWLKAYTHMSCIAVHSQRQYELATRELGIPAERLALIPYQVDATFWQPMDVPEERLICSAGLEFRDYPTLLAAVEGLDVKVIIGAASHWSKRRNTAGAQQLPPNVEVSSFDYNALRNLYARSAIVVVPLDDTDFQAGVTTILEAMAMGKPVIVTHSLGQTDVVEDRRSATRGASARQRPVSLLRNLTESAGLPFEPTGFYVPPEDQTALRKAIVYLLDRPDERRRLGIAGRETVERLLTVDQFATRIRHLVEAAVEPVDSSPIGGSLPVASNS